MQLFTGNKLVLSLRPLKICYSSEKPRSRHERELRQLRIHSLELSRETSDPIVDVGGQIQYKARVEMIDLKTTLH